jgi:hypothetical protein
VDPHTAGVAIEDELTEAGSLEFGLRPQEFEPRHLRRDRDEAIQAARPPPMVAVPSQGTVIEVIEIKG